MTDVDIRYGRESGPLAIAHRGGAGLAPENTMRAFQASYALGVRYLETDVRLTRDGTLIAFHDATLNRVTDGRGPVARATWQQLRTLQVDGEPIVRLVDLLDAFPDARWTIDVKDDRSVRPLAELIVRSGAANRVCVAGAWDNSLAMLRRLVGAQLSTALGWQELCRMLARAHAGMSTQRSAVSGAFVHVPLRIGRLPVLRGRVLDRARSLGVRVIVWTVNDPPTMRRLLDEGVDGIITDRPDLLRDVLVERDQWTPPGQVEPLRAPGPAS